MEDVTVRAITIGVGVLVSIVTITAVLTYYNTAKETVREIGSGVDIAGLYDQSIEDTLIKTKITGTDVKNIINYFEGKNADITVINIYNVNGKKENWGKINYNNLDWNKLNSILPNMPYKTAHHLDGDKIIITIECE